MILRTCNENFTSAHDPDFQWPNTIGAEVTPYKWDPSPECGNGLHGFQYGEGDRDLADWSDSAQWIVFAGDIIVNIDGQKVKTNKATILHIGQGETTFDRMTDCHNFMRKHKMLGNRAFRSTNTGGDSSTNTGGDRSTNTGGDSSTNTGGNRSTFSTGDLSSFTGNWYDGTRNRRKTFYSGEDYEAGKQYRFENGIISLV